MRDPHYDEDVLAETCGGTELLTCRCGGDFCVCHNHGEIPCGGCADCGDGDDGDDTDDDLEPLNPDDTDDDGHPW